MGLRSWLSGGGGGDTPERYTAGDARRDYTASWGNEIDTDGSSHAVEDRYRRDGIDRDYNGGERF